jgi:hypothetical protein
MRMLLALCCAALLDAQSDPCLGRWRMDPKLSKFDPGPPPVLQESFYWDAGQGMTGFRATIEYGGRPRFTMTWRARYDGKPYAVTGSPLYDTITYRRIDERTVEFDLRKGGKSVSKGRRVLAADGRSYTNHAEGIDAEGRRFRNASVYVKRDPFLGRWKLDPARSESNARRDQQALSITADYEEAEEGAVRFTATAIYPTQTFTMSWTARYDGRTYAVTGSPMYDSVRYEKIDERTVGFTLSKGGKAVSKGRRVLSEDGSSYTNFAERVEADGSRNIGKAVYVRVE